MMTRHFQASVLSEQLQQRWIVRASSLYLGTLKGEKGMRETRVECTEFILDFDYICLSDFYKTASAAKGKPGFLFSFEAVFVIHISNICPCLTWNPSSFSLSFSISLSVTCLCVCGLFYKVLLVLFSSLMFQRR
jgi:hypothetical protein